MWKKVLMGILLVLSATAGFFVAKAQVLYNNSLNQINRDYDTALANVDLSGIHVNSDDQIVIFSWSVTITERKEDMELVVLQIQ